MAESDGTFTERVGIADSLERLDSMIEAVSGKRLTYAGLTA